MSSVIFQSGAVWANSELSMVNECLLAIGEAPYIDGTIVESLPVGTDGEIAKRIVRSTMLEVQQKGWYFNTEYDFKLYPDVNDFVAVPPNVLRLDFGNSGNKHRYIIQGSSIYDRKDQTFKIKETLTADVVWLEDYSDLSIEAYAYITLRSARKFQQRVIGSGEIDQFTIRDEADALTDLQRVQMQTQDYKLQNHRVNTRIHNGYLVRGLYGNTDRRNF